MKRSLLLALISTLALAAVPAGAGGGDPVFDDGTTLPPSVPVGLVVTPMALSSTATSLSITPSGDALYVSATTSVLRFPLVAGVVAGPPSTFADGLSSTLGVLATEDGSGADTVFISAASGGDSGIVLRATDADGNGVADGVETVIDGLPNGRHDTNGLAIGPEDGMLYISNGNSTDSGFGAEGGDPEIQPYSGSYLRVDPAATDLTPTPDMVVATGFRNIYDIAFVPEDHPAYLEGAQRAVGPMNGPDGQTYGTVTRPLGEDTLSMFETLDDDVEHLGFPWCLYDRNNGGLEGFAQDPSIHDDCSTIPDEVETEGLAGPIEWRKPIALFGMNVSADGLEFNPGGSFPAEYDNDLFVTEWGNLFGTTPKGHKIVRVRFDQSGGVISTENFMTGIVPLDLTFAPDGSMWVADFSGLIYRIAGVV